MTRISSVLLDLMALYPKGCAEPRGYTDWHDWAKAQKAHGLQQHRCHECGLWVFPQSKHSPNCSKGLPPRATGTPNE